MPRRTRYGLIKGIAKLPEAFHRFFVCLTRSRVRRARLVDGCQDYPRRASVLAADCEPRRPRVVDLVELPAMRVIRRPDRRLHDDRADLALHGSFQTHRRWRPSKTSRRLLMRHGGAPIVNPGIRVGVNAGSSSKHCSQRGCKIHWRQTRTEQKPRNQRDDSPSSKNVLRSKFGRSKLLAQAYSGEVKLSRGTHCRQRGDRLRKSITNRGHQETTGATVHGPAAGTISPTTWVRC